MRIKSIWLVFILFLAIAARAQQDSVAYSIDSRINDGVYLTYADFRRNNAITKEQIKSPLEKEQLNFIEKTLKQQKFSYTKNDILYTTESNNIWGFFQNNTLYLNYGHEFYRIPVFGAITYLAINFGARDDGSNAPVYVYGIDVRPAFKESHQFIMDFYDGVIGELSMEKVEALLSRDADLYAEFMKLKKRKRKDELYRYIRKYNTLHPVYFLK